MISGTVSIINNSLIIDLTVDGRIVTNDFEKLMLLRDVVMDAVNNFEKENQKKFLEEAKQAPKYEEKF